MITMFNAIELMGNALIFMLKRGNERVSTMRESSRQASHRLNLYYDVETQRLGHALYLSLVCRLRLTPEMNITSVTVYVVPLHNTGQSQDQYQVRSRGWTNIQLVLFVRLIPFVSHVSLVEFIAVIITILM